MSIFQNNSTQIITSDILLNEGGYIGENVTLIFQGGMIKINPNLQLLPPSLTITGQHTKIIAPITQIFGDSINVDGTWDIDRAYPQWFGAKPEDKEGYETTVTWNAATDCSEAINKAITMKQVGEVFIPCGYYKIRKPILIPIGIQLNGEKGMVGMSNSLRTINHHNDGTILVADRFLNQFPNNPTSNFMVYVNAKVTNGNLERLTDEDFLSGQITGISNICFKCKTWDRDNGMIPLLNSGGIGTNDGISPQVLNPLENPFDPIYTVYIDYSYNLGCIYAMMHLHINNVRFEGFIQAVHFNTDHEVWGYSYFDTKLITNCDYTCDIEGYNVSPDDKKYAFDLGFLGDAMIFEHNTIQAGKCNKGVKVAGCGGGRIASNIINADVTIEACKALDFSNNHIEGGKTLTIFCSNVTTSSNFFEMGVNPSVIIQGGPEFHDKCIVTMNNDAFLFYDYPRDYTQTDLTGAELMSQWEEDFLNSLDNRYDIVLDHESSLKLTNLYRQWLGEGLFGKIYITGINLGKVSYSDPTYDSLDDFNNYSYQLSKHCVVSFHHIVEIAFTIKKIPEPNVFAVMKNNTIYWMGDDGNYFYAYQILYDLPRLIAASSSLMPSDGTFFTHNKDQNEQDRLDKYQHGGVLICIDHGNNHDGCFMLRLFRKGSLTDNSYCYHYVDIPICGTNFLYDNGIAINGFAWRQITSNNQNPFEEYVIQGNSNIDSVDYRGDNIMCRLEGTNQGNSSSQWKKGDILVNMGTTTSIEIINEDEQ